MHVATRKADSARIIRVGLIGCGKMGLQHLKAISRTPGARIVGVADPAVDTDHMRGLLPRDAEVLADPAELFERLRPDVVHVVTPPAAHYSLARQALDAGCNVYIEKPFTPTRREAELLLAHAREQGLLVCAGHQYLFERPSLLALEALATMGRLTHVESYFSFRMVRRTITPVDQAKDILPHAVYPLVAQMRAGTGLEEDPIRITAIDARSEGDVYALFRLGDCAGVLIVTLSGRPVEQYQHLVGSNGCLRADYITGGLVRLQGPGAGLGVLFTPYRRSWQTQVGATRGFGRLVLGRTTSYPGLQVLIERFYASVREGGASPITPRSIVETVGICEEIGGALDAAALEADASARERLTAADAGLPPAIAGRVFVTGGTGLLGRRVVEELRHAGFSVMAAARRVPRDTMRVPGVEYVPSDLARPVDPELIRGADVLVHCAAETAGGKEEHERNSIAATRHVIEAAAAAGLTRVVHISSLAVLEPGRWMGRPLDERTPVDAGNLGRGPYVWGKAQSEQLAQQRGAELGLDVKVIRPGPLVDFADFQPPGRLGREVGPFYVAVGGRRSHLSICDVGTAARVIRSYVEDFERAPAMLNLIESPPPQRRELVARLRGVRPDLRVIWFPALVLRAISPMAKLAQRLLLGSQKPIDLSAAFASERYRTDLAGAEIGRAGPSSLVKGPKHAPAGDGPPPEGPRPRSVLVCHAESRLNSEGVARWLSSFTDLAGIVSIEENGRQRRARVKRELRRSGLLRFIDVLAFRLYYMLSAARKDARWLDAQLDRIALRYPRIPRSVEVLRTADPNTGEVEAFIRRLAPDLAVVRCKRILKERIFELPRHGTFVLHPGICPEYRNAHGAFWALATGDLKNVGLTLLKIDKGVDTGPVYGYYTTDFDELNESHIVIMTRLVLDNLDSLRDRLLEIYEGRAVPIDTKGRASAVWGQPWLTTYLRWKRDARRRLNAGLVARIP
jgi:predicted dehydrogenase/nucleoside-diphosphate-sugar epimerase